MPPEPSPRLLDIALACTTPLLVIDLDHVAAQCQALRAALPEARILYAVKANPHAEVLRRLAALGCGFDIASPGELERCLSVGIAAADMSYGNPAKKEADIAEAYRAGVRLFAFDSAMELQKLARVAPGSRVFARLAVAGVGAEWPLTHKFGCTIDTAVTLLLRARTLGLDAAGLSFHVGSQQTAPDAWRHAIHRAAQVFRQLARHGIDLEFLNLGGGLPARYAAPVPPLEAYTETMRAALLEHFGGSAPVVFIEPGRFMVGDAGILATTVILVAERPHERVPRWVYLDAGRFSGLDETMDERIRYRLFVPGRERSWGPAVLAGPTCDSADVLYRHQMQLPVDLDAGERVIFLAAGAYTATCSSVDFNGFPPLAVRCV